MTASTEDAPDMNLVTKAGKDLWEQLSLVSLIKPRTIFHFLCPCHKSTVNIKFQRKEKSLIETAVFNIQPVYSGKWLEMEKFPFLLCLFLIVVFKKLPFVNKGSLVLNSFD